MDVFIVEELKELLVKYAQDKDADALVSELESFVVRFALA